MQQFENVQEHWGLVDTVMVVSQPESVTGPSLPQGWFNTLTQMGAANDLPFFNVRNRNIGIQYNNQDARDQMPYAMRLFSIGVSFWRTPMTTDQFYVPGSPYDDVISHIFMVDLPRHCSLVLQIQQDERLKTIVPFCSPGYGPSGGAWGRGRPSTMDTVAPPAGIDAHYQTFTQGVPDIKRRWMFPDNISIPRRASLSVKLRFSEYARNLLQQLGAQQSDLWNITGNQIAGFAGIQVSLIGERLVQQRGQYHA